MRQKAVEDRLKAESKYRKLMTPRELNAFIDGVYSGIKIANQKLKEHPDQFGTNLKIKVPSRSRMIKMLRHK
jgi:hypothetical protein